MNNSNLTNPFLVSRVDNPFQQHPDLKILYENQFNTLCSAINEIKKDKNSQSRAVTITGAPGSGKTHLSMRLANEILSSNRLLFIRQPNNKDSVYLHIYTRILESMVEKVPGTDYSQLAYLLGKSFAGIMIKKIGEKKTLTAKDKNILELLKADPMNIYKKIGGAGTETRRKNWKYIEAKTLEWWESNYSPGSNTAEIIKGFIKYCSYTDPKRKQLVYRWLNFSDLSEDEYKLTGLTPANQTSDPEEFALDAMIVISRLSLADEPLVIIFDQLEGLKYNEELLFKFFESVKELFTHIPNSLFIFNLFTDRWEKWKKIIDPSVIDRLSQTIIHLQNPGNDMKLQILEMRAQEAGFLPENIFNEDDLRVITDNTSIRSMLVSASAHFRHKTGKNPLPVLHESFEERIENEIRDLKEEVNSLKKYLNMTVPTFREVMESEHIEDFFEEKKFELLKKKAELPVYSETDDAGKILVISNIFKGTMLLETGRLKAGKRKIPEHVLLKGKNSSVTAGFLHMSGNSLTGRLKNLLSLCQNNPETDFYILRDYYASKIKSKVAKKTFEELNKENNFRFIQMTKKDRLNFELIYEMITAIQNKDLDAEPAAALRIAQSYFGGHFIFEIIDRLEK